MASVSAVDLQPRLAQLNAEYARALDDDRLEDWPTFFAESCLYVVTTAEIENVDIRTQSTSQTVVAATAVKAVIVNRA